jgi:hypothetical protein
MLVCPNVILNVLLVQMEPIVLHVSPQELVLHHVQLLQLDSGTMEVDLLFYHSVIFNVLLVVNQIPQYVLVVAEKKVLLYLVVENPLHVLFMHRWNLQVWTTEIIPGVNLIMS